MTGLYGPQGCGASGNWAQHIDAYRHSALGQALAMADLGCHLHYASAPAAATVQGARHGTPHEAPSAFDGKRTSIGQALALVFLVHQAISPPSEAKQPDLLLTLDGR